MPPPNRKPDFETESFRAWKPTEKQIQDIEADRDNHINVERKGEQFALIGFTKVNKGKEWFAYKFNHEKRLVLYYMPITLNREEREEAIANLAGICDIFGYSVLDVKDWLDRVISEKHALGTMGDKQ